MVSNIMHSGNPYAVPCFISNASKSDVACIFYQLLIDSIELKYPFFSFTERFIENKVIYGDDT